MAPRNDPGKNDESPSQLREVMRRANVVLDEAATEEESSNEDDDDDGRDPEASGYAPIPMTPPHTQREETESEEEENLADLDMGILSRLDLRQIQRPEEEGIISELSPRVSSMVQADQLAHRREEARERDLVFQGASSPSDSSMEMGPAKVESIRKVMAGISLPESAVPNWAKEMSDTDWHEMVTKKLKQ